MTEAISAFGVVLERGVYEIAEITNIDGLEITRETYDVYHHGSLDTFREYIPGSKDASEIAIEGNFIAGDANGQRGLESDLNNGNLQNFTLTFPATITATWAFSAYVTAFKVGGFPVDGKLPFSASLKISGKPELGITLATALGDLALTSATLIPTFDAAVYDYIATATAATIKVTPTSAASYITVNGNVVLSGSDYDISIGAIGTMVNIVVKTHDTGKAPRTYKIKANRIS